MTADMITCGAFQPSHTAAGRVKLDGKKQMMCKPVGPAVTQCLLQFAYLNRCVVKSGQGLSKKQTVDMTVKCLAYRQMLCADLNPCEDNLKQSYLQQFLFGLEGHDFRANDGCTGV